VLVLDASAAVELVLGTPTGRAVAAQLQDEVGPLHAPHLIDVEVLSALRRLVRTKDVSVGEAERALSQFGLLPIERYPHSLLTARAWALRASVSAYDAMYVALAEALPARMLTCERRLARAHGHRAKVVVAVPR
jgi:predicted nucleic acid-binding protein